MPESIQVLEKRYGLVPSKIDWRGRIVQIDAVEQCWTEMRRLRGEVLYHFHVWAGGKRYRLSENAKAGTWTLLQQS